MATHSSILAWKIPWTEEPGRLQSMGLQRAGHRLSKYILQNNQSQVSWFGALPWLFILVSVFDCLLPTVLSKVSFSWCWTPSLIQIAIRKIHKSFLCLSSLVKRLEFLSLQMPSSRACVTGSTATWVTYSLACAADSALPFGAHTGFFLSPCPLPLVL